VEDSPSAPEVKRGRRYRYLRRTAIALLAAVAVGMVLFLGLLKLIQNPGFCRFLADRIEKAAAESGTVHVEIGSLKWEFFPFRLTLEGLALKSPEFDVDITEAGIAPGGVRISQRTLVFSLVDLDGVSIKFCRKPRSSEKKPGLSALNVIVRNLNLRRVDIDGRLLDAAISIRDGEIAWVRQGREESGYVRAGEIRFTSGKMDEVRGRLAGSFFIRDRVLNLRKLSLLSNGYSLSISGRATPQGFSGKLTGDLRLEELDRVVRSHRLLRGDLSLQADINTARKEPFRVRARSREIVVAGGFPLHGLHGTIEVSPRGLTGRLEGAEFFGGELSGTYHLDGFAPSFPHRVEASCVGMDLARLLRVLHVPPGGLSAGMSIQVSTRWGGRSFPSGNGRAEILFSPRPGELPVSGRLGLGLTGEGFLEFDTRDLMIGSSPVDFQGPLVIGSWQPAWAIHAEPADLEEILPAVNRWVGSRVFPEDISGTGKLDVSLDGPWHDLRVGLRLDAHNLQFAGIVIDRADLEGVVAGGAFEMKDSHFRIGEGAGNIAGFLRWKPEPLMDLQWEGRKLPLEKIGGWLGIETGTVGGTLSFSGGLRGQPNAPGGSWAVSMQQVKASGIDFGDGAASLSLEDGVFLVRNLTFDHGLEGSMTWAPGAHVLTGTLGWKQMKLPEHLRLNRKLLSPPFDVECAFRWPYLEGPPRGNLRLENQFLKAHCGIDEERITLQAHVGDALDVGFEIPDFDVEKSWESSGEISIPSLEAFDEIFLGRKDIGLSGRIAVGIRIGGCGMNPDSLEAAISRFEVSFNQEPVELKKAGKLRMDTHGINLSETVFRSGNEEMHLAGGIDDRGVLKGFLRGDLDARLLRFILPDWETGGSLSGSITLGGTPADPRLSGTATVKNASFRLPGTSMVLADIDGKIDLDHGRIEFSETGFRLLKGRGHASGYLQLGDEGVHVDFTGDISDMNFPLFEGMTPRISGSWRLDGPVGRMLLSGQLVIESAELRTKMDLPTLLLNWFGGPTPPKSESGLNFDLRLRSDESLIARSPMIRLTGSADLRLLGSPEAPGLEGRISFEDGGEVVIQGIRYEVTRAHLSFSDSGSINPMLNINLQARIHEYQVWVQLYGSIDRMIPIVSSDPPLSPPEIYSLMSMGAPDSGSGAGGAIGLSVASSMLSNRLQNALESRDLWLLPIDQVRIDPFIENSTGDPSARVSVVKQLSSNVTVTLQSDLSAEKNQVITVRWYLGAGLFVEASRDQDGQIGADFKLRRRY